MVPKSRFQKRPGHIKLHVSVAIIRLALSIVGVVMYGPHHTNHSMVVCCGEIGKNLKKIKGFIKTKSKLNIKWCEWQFFFKSVLHHLSLGTPTAGYRLLHYSITFLSSTLPLSMKILVVSLGVGEIPTLKQ